MLGLDVPPPARSVAETQETRHLRALELLDATLGAGLDPEAPADQVIDGYWMGLSKRSLLAA